MASSLQFGQRFNPWRRFRGVFIPETILRLPGSTLSPGAKLTYGALLFRAGRDGRCFPKHDTLAASIGCSASAVRRNLGDLRRLKLIESERRQWHNQYFFLWHPLLAECPALNSQTGSEHPSVETQGESECSHVSTQASSDCSGSSNLKTADRSGMSTPDRSGVNSQAYPECSPLSNKEKNKPKERKTSNNISRTETRESSEDPSDADDSQVFLKDGQLDPTRWARTLAALADPDLFPGVAHASYRPTKILIACEEWRKRYSITDAELASHLNQHGVDTLIKRPDIRTPVLLVNLAGQHLAWVHKQKHSKSPIGEGNRQANDVGDLSATSPTQVSRSEFLDHGVLDAVSF